MNAPLGFGIDVGSTTVKVVCADSTGRMIWRMLEPSRPRLEQQINEMMATAQAETLDHGIGPDAGEPGAGLALVATGYGRRLVRGAERQVTEITCHARGCFASLGHGGTLVDIGGQDSKVIRIGEHGRVLDFAMNDKCAAGTGRFLENSARRLEVSISELGPRALSASGEVVISSTCTVFAETEMISLIAQGVALDRILKGLHRALIKRISATIRSVGLTPPLMLSGGVVLNPAVPQLLEEEMGQEVIIPRDPQLTGAYGAALLALESGAADT
jgi:predicted CoA-substrate-specific enzyme activase